MWAAVPMLRMCSLSWMSFSAFLMLSSLRPMGIPSPRRGRDALELLLLLDGLRGHVAPRGEEELVREAVHDGLPAAALGGAEGLLHGARADRAERHVEPARRRDIDGARHGDAAEPEARDLLARRRLLEGVDEGLHGVLLRLPRDLLHGQADHLDRLRLLPREVLRAHHPVDEALDDVHLRLAERLGGVPAARVREDERGEVDVPGKAGVVDGDLGQVVLLEEEDLVDELPALALGLRLLRRGVDRRELGERGREVEGREVRRWRGRGAFLHLPHRLLLAPAHELVQGDVVDLDHLVADAGDVPVRAAHAPADPLDEDLVVLVDEVDRPLADGERGDLPPVLDELDLHALPQRRVRLLRLDGDLLEHDAAPLGGALEGVGLYLEVEDAALVVPVRPAPGLADVVELAGGVEASGQGEPSLREAAYKAARI